MLVHSESRCCSALSQSCGCAWLPLQLWQHFDTALSNVLLFLCNLLTYTHAQAKASPKAVTIWLSVGLLPSLNTFNAGLSSSSTGS